MNDTQLMQYYGYTEWLEGKAYSILTLDPCNKVYAAWLVTIAGDQAKNIWSNNRERLGDVVECALALCWMIDEYPQDLGHLLVDPKACWEDLKVLSDGP